MAEKMSTENKGKFRSSEKIRSNSASKKDLKEAKKSKQLKKKRLIIRNLSFKVSEEELKKIFSEFGEVLDVNIPVQKDGKKRGFAFIQFKKTSDQIRAMKALNFKKINGRPIAIDFAVDKTTYQSNRNSLKSPDLQDGSESHNEELSVKSEEDEDEEKNSEDSIPDEDEDKDEGDTKVKKFLREFDADKEDDDSENESSSGSSNDSDSEEETVSSKHANTDDVDDDSDDDDNSDKEEEDESPRKRLPPKKRKSEDVSEGKTVFIRNVSFKTTEEELEVVVKEYGDTVYCLLCTDPFSGHSKGTAFVKFKQKESAEKFIEDSEREPGISLDGRRLNCILALSKEDVMKKQKEPEKAKDKRNLCLLKHGLITYGSKEAEGVSQPDMSKRAQLEMAKKQKLRNVNFFVSDKRLVIHNLPKNINNEDLYKMFKNAASKGAVIKEHRVMRDFKKTDAQGVPVSRGFGFVAFAEHEHALQALMELNNNPKVFTPYKRPIVEFSVENKVALVSKEKRIEKIKMRNKRKQEEQDNENNEASLLEEESQKPNTQKRKNKVSRNKRKHSKTQTESLNKNVGNDSSGRTESSPKKKKCKKSRKNRFQNAEWKSSVQASTEKYKEKLNKIF